jgi:hypothetical protein
VQAEKRVDGLLKRNWKCVEELTRALCQPPLELPGEQVREIVFAHANEADVQRLKKEQLEFL